MAPPRICSSQVLTAAERARRYRHACKEAGKSASSGPSGKRLTAFEAGEFVAVDGEGFSEGEVIVHRSDSGIEYRGRPHFYALLSASDGSEIYNPEGRLSAAQCLDFLCAIKERNKRAILVSFFSSYDVTQMLAYDLTREQIDTLLHPPEFGKRAILELTFGGFDYKLEYRARKSFSIWRWPRGVPKYQRQDNGKSKIVNALHVVLWDTWGFFQSNFAGAMASWLPNDADADMIRREKGRRAVFSRSEIDDIRRYNAAELRCLVAIMEKVRDAVSAMGLTISEWHGAGAISGAMMRANKVKLHKAKSPDGAFRAALHAFSGGHIEVCKIGRHSGPVHHYDINSAYPDQFRNLPSLDCGMWTNGTGEPPEGFTLVRVEYQFKHGLPFYPLFHREANGRIIYPPRGAGWYHYSEFAVAREFARKFGAVHFKVCEWWHMQPADTAARPFKWVEAYYERRKFLVEQSKRSKIPNGEEKTLKLGYNGCYGKTAQQVGAKKDEEGNIVEPSYFQIEWAGYVTAGCRAKLMRAAMEKPDAIIGFATDGLFSTEPLAVDAPAEKILGAWEYQIHAGMTMVMPGVYWLHENDPAKDVLHSRGFDKAQMSGADIVLRAWSRKQERLRVNLTRLVGLGSALTSEAMWALRGMFVTMTKELALNGDNSKRYPAMLYRLSPHRQLCDTEPRDHYADLLTPLEELFSAPYPLDWAAQEQPQDVRERDDVEAARNA